MFLNGKTHALKLKEGQSYQRDLRSHLCLIYKLNI